MIWYILYPFRGTTEPPRLPPSHPIRRAFEAHGTATARHWLLSILLTIVVSVLLCYPAVFHTDSPAAAGLRNLPKHVWTSTTEVDHDRPADVEVRQVWVHGDYMNAIDRRVLRKALYVQDALIGDGFEVESAAAPGVTHMFTADHNGCPTMLQDSFQWGVHSPLMYWNCSLGALEADPSPLTTINSRAGQRSHLNLTLRPSTVFAGKSFINKKLHAADALVITLFDQTNPSLGAIWDARASFLAEELKPDWSIFPENGRVTRSRYYEFRFRPMTLADDLFLAGSYLVTAAYVVWRMMQLRAIKSWFGLLVTVCAKMTVCVIGSFTLCTYLGVDLARIPRPWFPGVVFCFGLGNIFRLINAVLETPPEMPPVQRIGTAIGEVGHLSLAVAGQNLVLIWLCSRIVTPWVADFCVFAAVTLVLDLVFHLTFFLAVLSVDVQRMELQDSLERVDLTRTSKSGKLERQTWLGALRQGNIPLSTRFAGPAAIFSIILALNWHFFDEKNRHMSVRDAMGRLTRHAKRTANSRVLLKNSAPINQARTPAEWLKIQDHNTARELFGIIKPNAQSFIARVYDPLLVVLRDAEGRDTSEKLRRPLTESLRRFAKEHAFPAALMVVFLIAGVTLLMNYLLWSGVPENTDETEDEDALFLVKTLPAPQTLDIVQLAASPKGSIASISLDRSTSLWLHDRIRGYTHTTLQTAAMKPRLWPLVGSAFDNGGNLLALCSEEGQIGLWGVAAARFVQFPTVELRGQPPTLFTFFTTHGTERSRLSLLLLTHDGYLTEIEIRNGVTQTKRICTSSILSATLYTASKDDMNLVFVNKFGEVHILSLKEDSQWTSEVVAGLDPGPPPDSNPHKIKCVYPVSSLGLIFAIRTEEVEIFDFNSRALLHALEIGHVKPHTFRVLHSARRLCSCGARAVHSISVAYTEQDTNHMIMQTFTLDDNATSQICLGKPSDAEAHKCEGLDRATEAVHCVEPAGVWESTGTLSVVGIRKRARSQPPSSTVSEVDDDDDDDFTSAPGSSIKLRAKKPTKRKSLFPSLETPFVTRPTPPSPSDPDTWEAWTLSTTGEFRSRPLTSDPSPEDPDVPDADEQLFVANPGPITRLGKRSVAVGYGNTVKVLTLGKESFDGISGGEDLLDAGLGMYNLRTKRGTGRKTQ
ncbi:sterol-sensing domain of SREBP cleavage-activation-domain-containing protein [Lophiotrema nucula]|uniref:Sterol-sensing domain of SREBP cleavage-activation-domain-containing protein n=1 Tax=Lophiotrema nucula TaxID=690887 RepID=A0A6A5YNL5_9PLEO|nr:sterol-sensing domain of SREBP cleavage-activation-domain-containing protein [Lophiotrema nucula]